MKLLRIKTENLLTFLLLPYSIINITKASSEMFIASIMMQLIILIGVYYGTKETRKALILEVQNGLLEEVKEDLIESLEPLLEAIETTRKVVKGIKKEVIRKHVKTTKLKDAFLKI